MKKTFVWLAILLSLCILGNVEGDDRIDDSGFLPLPPADYETLYPDEMTRIAAEGLRKYYLDFTYNEEILHCLYPLHKMEILSDPYVLLVEQENGGGIIYCCSYISECCLSQDENGLLQLEEYSYSLGAFRVYFSYDTSGKAILAEKTAYRMEDGELYMTEPVYQIQNGEELFFGSGAGGEGVPGYSDEIIDIIGDQGFTAERIVKRYMETNGIDAEFVRW